MKVRYLFSGYQGILILLFVLSLPLVNPWVRGDGVEYYAYVRSLVIDGDLHFEDEWQAANPSFRNSKLDAEGHVFPSEYTATGYVKNIASVGPSLLWIPFFVAVHLLVLVLNHFGTHIVPDGYSRPYLVVMGLASALYGFLGLLLAFRLALAYFDKRCAFLATLGIWFASSLPVYMYFNPSWSHAHSAFSVALFLWYWHRTRGQRSIGRWAWLGLASGLMLNVYYMNGIVLLVPFLEAVNNYWRAWRNPAPAWPTIRRLLVSHVAYVATTLVAFLPTLLTRQIIFGHPLAMGYAPLKEWSWGAPALAGVLFSADHGLLSWTPVLLLAVLGLVLFWRYDRAFASYLICTALVFFYVIASYPSWDGLSSFGNRFFVSLTPVFVLGLAATLERFSSLLPASQGAFTAAWIVITLLVLWNAGFVFQWGIHLIPARGAISWRTMTYNQFEVVPARIVGSVKEYFFCRREMMEQIEKEDIKEIEGQGPHEKGGQQ